MEPCDLETGREEFGPTRGYAIATRKGIKLRCVWMQNEIYEQVLTIHYYFGYICK